MENDVLKNKIAPWQEEGRWYKIRIKSLQLDQNESDPNFNAYFSASSNYIYLPPKFVLCDYKMIYDDFTVTSDTNINPVIRLNSAGRIGFSTGHVAATITDISFTVYVFGYFK